MTADQIAILLIFAGVFGLFLWGWLRYDLVAFLALIVSILVGVIPADDAFAGFGHPAVITVAAVLIVSRGLQVSGAIDRVARIAVPPVKSLPVQIGGMAGFAATLSAFMNNVGALALLMPATIQSAKKVGRSPSLLLMPLSFGSILGGMVTMIGTPPNIIIANYRGQAMGSPFGMFDFSPVGLAVTLVGIAYLALIGWRLLPKERSAKSAADELFDIDAYVCELRLGDESPWIGRTLREMEEQADALDARVAGLMRGRRKVLLTAGRHQLQAKDIIVVQAEPAVLDKLVHKTGLEMAGTPKEGRSRLTSDSIALLEGVVSADGRTAGRTVGDLRLRSRYGVTLLGISRQGRPIRQRLHKVVLQTGDILLFQADFDAAPETMTRLGLLPLAGRDLQIGKRDQAGLAVGMLAIAVLLASFGVIPLTLALVMAALGTILMGVVPLRDVYDAVEWPVIVLIASMIPVGQALEATGATQLIADGILTFSAGFPAWLVMTILLVATMTLSDIMNNTATAVVMAPIGVSMATSLGANPDAFLMAVAVGASCAFLTPIGHKNNALILGPGGYRFGDYWRMGLPLEILVTAVAIPAILLFFPL